MENQPKSRPMFRRILAVLLLFAIACGGVTEPKAEMSGTWEGISGGQRIHLVLTESKGTVLGAGTIGATNSILFQTVQVTGAFNDPEFVLVLSSTSPQLVINFTGTYNPSRPPQLVGKLVGGTLNGADAVLNKQ